MHRIFNLYKNAFGGLSKPAWMLALVILINRSGTMVIPFLSVYLSSSLGFTLVETGWVMSMFGLGAIFGALLGGWLTDRIGHFKVQFISLFFGGFCFLLLSEVTTFKPLAGLIFFVSIVTEMLRPANQVSIASYARPENVTRAFSLNRMAINLGFSLGPALGGLLASVSYRWLFYADAFTCMAAGILFFFYFRTRRGNQVEVATVLPTVKTSVWKDQHFLLFILLVIGFGTLFFQLFSTWPIYHREVFHLQESQIGLLLGLNGMIVFSLEMIIVYLVGERFAIRNLIAIGCLLLSLSFVTLYFSQTITSLYLACILISLAEILGMPYMATYTVRRSGDNRKGAYLGLYSMGFASAFFFAPLIGTRVISFSGFQSWWLVASVAAIIIGISFFWTVKKKST